MFTLKWKWQIRRYRTQRPSDHFILMSFHAVTEKKGLLGLKSPNKKWLSF